MASAVPSARTEPGPSAGTLPPRYWVPLGSARVEQQVKRSRFVGSVARASDEEAARAYLAAVREAFPDADHHAWAYRSAPGPQRPDVASSDDSEPGGTAGRPMLAVLEGAGLHEVVAVGTRYCGGIKLGTGGLVRAYSGIVRLALADLPIGERVLHRLAEVRADYALYGALRHQLPRLGARIEEAVFGPDVLLRLAVPAGCEEEAGALLRELSNGAVSLPEAWVNTRYDEVGR